PCAPNATSLSFSTETVGPRDTITPPPFSAKRRRLSTSNSDNVPTSQTKTTSCRSSSTFGNSESGTVVTRSQRELAARSAVLGDNACSTKNVAASRGRADGRPLTSSTLNSERTLSGNQRSL